MWRIRPYHGKIFRQRSLIKHLLRGLANFLFFLEFLDYVPYWTLLAVDLKSSVGVNIPFESMIVRMRTATERISVQAYCQ
jgi:hypothetical protein